MRILIAHNAYQSHHVGGEDIVVANETAGLQKILGHEKVHSYIVSNDDIKYAPLAVNLWSNREHYRNIQKMIRQHKIDIVHVHNFFPLLTPSVFVGAKMAGATVIHTLHNFRWWCIAGTLFKNNVICEKCLHRTLGISGMVHGCYRGSKLQSVAAGLAFSWYKLKDYAQHIDAYFVLTKFQREKLQSLIPSHKMWLKPNAVEKPSTIVPLDQKKGYVFVGRLEEAKGIDTLLAQWQQLPLHLQLTIIGSGEREAYLREKYGRENIHFLGKLSHDQTLTQIAKAQYLIHPSLTYETFGLTLVEALSRGTPVIGFDIGPRKEFIHHGLNGFLCDKENLSNCVLSSYDFPHYAALSAKAIVTAQAYHRDEIYPQQIRLYQKIMSKAYV